MNFEKNPFNALFSLHLCEKCNDFTNLGNKNSLSTCKYFEALLDETINENDI